MVDAADGGNKEAKAGKGKEKAANTTATNEDTAAHIHGRTEIKISSRDTTYSQSGVHLTLTTQSEMSETDQKWKFCGSIIDNSMELARSAHCLANVTVHGYKVPGLNGKTLKSELQLQDALLPATRAIAAIREMHGTSKPSPYVDIMGMLLRYPHAVEQEALYGMSIVKIL